VSTQDWHNLTIEVFPFATDTASNGTTRAVNRQWYDTSADRGSMTVPQTDEAATDATAATPRAEISMSQTDAGDITLVIGALSSSATLAADPHVRTWYVRLHLSPGEHFGEASLTLDREPVSDHDYRILGGDSSTDSSTDVARAGPAAAPNANKTLLGLGSMPPHVAGPILEMQIQSMHGQVRTVGVKAMRG
jgi:hypothetical protein